MRVPLPPATGHVNGIPAAAGGGSTTIQRQGHQVNWKYVAIALAQVVLSAVLFVVGVSAAAPADVEKGRFFAVIAKPSIAVRAGLGAGVGGAVLAVASGAIFVHGCSALQPVRDQYLAPWLNQFWAPAGLAKNWRSGLILSSRGRVLVLAAVVVFVAAVVHIPNALPFDGNPELSKQFGTAAGDCMAVALIPLPKHSVLLPMLGVPFERAVFFHKFLGRASVILTPALPHPLFQHLALPSFQI